MATGNWTDPNCGQLQLVVRSFAVGFSSVSVIFSVQWTGPVNTMLEPSQAMWPMMLTFNADRLLDRHRIASVIHRSPSRIRLMPSFKSELQNPSIAGPDSPSGLYSLDGWGGPSDGVRMCGFLILWRQIDHNWVVNLIEAARWSKITSLLCVWRIFIYTMVSMLIHLCSVYYCLYATDGAIKSFNPIYSNDPFISRILPKSLTPPHTVLSIKKYLCKTEGLSGSNTSLFESLPHIC